MVWINTFVQKRNPAPDNSDLMMKSAWDYTFILLQSKFRTIISTLSCTRQPHRLLQMFVGPGPPNQDKEQHDNQWREDRKWHMAVATIPFEKPSKLPRLLARTNCRRSLSVYLWRAYSVVDKTPFSPMRRSSATNQNPSIRLSPRNLQDASLAVAHAIIA